MGLTIPRGFKLGVIGTTGSGKSTLLDLLMGLLSPDEGRVLVDGHPIDATGAIAWQGQIAHVPQSVFLLDASVVENIAFGVRVEDIDWGRVVDAARRAQLLGTIEALPLTWQTCVGERGVQLSGGQRQRLGIARALYKRAKLLVLDEATSALDDETEAAVMRAVEALDGDMTIVIVAHRLSTLRNCDRVIRVEGGQIVEASTVNASGGRSAQAGER